jgi:hypothetical protein
MGLKDDFVFRPLPALKDTIHFPFPIPNPLGPLAAIGGEWKRASQPTNKPELRTKLERK